MLERVGGSSRPKDLLELIVHIFRSWTQRVKRGDWHVGPKGVVQGIEEWRKTDTEEHWDKFVVSASW